MRDFNFFLPYLGIEKESKNTKHYVWGLAILMSSFILISLIWNSISIYMIKGNIAKLDSELKTPEMQENYNKTTVLFKRHELLTKYNNEIDVIYTAIKGREIVSSSMIKNLSDSLPKDVYFKNLVVDGQAISVNAVAKSRISVGEFQHNVKNLNFIKEAHVSNINLSSEGNAQGEYSFSIKCTLKDVDVNESK